MLWGWIKEVAIIAMTWTGVPRMGESLAACRSDLVLPEDAAPGTQSALLKVRLPKTRGRAARYQSTRIDPIDVVQLLIIAFSRPFESERLWPGSPSMLRRRFAVPLSALGLVNSAGAPHCALSSLKPGGATFWLWATEDAEFVRPKGRWLSTRVLEIYLQEASVMTYQDKLLIESKSRIESLRSSFPEILNKVQ